MDKTLEGTRQATQPQQKQTTAPAAKKVLRGTKQATLPEPCIPIYGM